MVGRVIDVWLCEKRTIAISEAQTLLSDDEQQSAFQMSAKRREDWIIGRALLRIGLGLNEEALPIQTNKAGKPYIDRPNTFFNISHTHNWVVCAISRDAQQLGVDIETT